ncbi:DUF1289 domain-containing protein [Metapseudomonas otitidis]
MSSTSSEPPPEPRPASPCVRRCCLDDADICIGCGRSLSEILQWGEASDDRRQQICRDAAQRLAARRP